MKASDVFVAGGLPNVTYNPRGELDLEHSLKEYLELRHKILSVSGPTKSGKTVLVRKVVPKESGVWIPGGQISKIEIFWDLIIARTGAFTSTTVTDGNSSEEATGRNLKASAGAFGIGGEAQSTVQRKDGKSGSVGSARVVVNAVTAMESLIRNAKPLIIDDFHYIAPEIQQEIIRSLKDPVFEGLPVILVSVPHRAFDAVKLEKEMTGRVKPLAITPWSEGDLLFIAERGFEILNVNCDISIARRLAAESFGSPHLMQDFCQALCIQNGIKETLSQRSDIPPMRDWPTFFQGLSTQTSKLAFERLAQGPRQRTERIARRMRNGSTCDIYVAILLAIASTGPKPTLTYEDVRIGLRKVLADDLPEANQVSFTLEKMSEIARTEIEGEPVVDWDGQRLHVSDPFFAYYLKWGTNWSSESEPTSSQTPR